MRKVSLLPLLAALLWVIVILTALARVGSVTLFLAVSGTILIVMSLISPQLRRWLGWPEPGAGFTNPRYVRSAIVTDRLGRLILVLIGLGFVVQGVNTGPLSNDWLSMILLLIVISAGVLIAVMIIARLVG